MAGIEKGTRRDALDAYFPLSVTRARVCSDYTEVTALTVPPVPPCGHHHDWQGVQRATWVLGSART